MFGFFILLGGIIVLAWFYVKSRMSLFEEGPPCSKKTPPGLSGHPYLIESSRVFRMFQDFHLSVSRAVVSFITTPPDSSVVLFGLLSSPLSSKSSFHQPQCLQEVPLDPRFF